MRITYVNCDVLLLAMVVIGFGCEELKRSPESKQPAVDTRADFDRDGLSDVDEMQVYHTSPKTRDTDGDGYDDYQEIHELGYDPSNPTKFNPLVADVPRIDIEFTTPPKVTVVYSRSTGETKTTETEETDTKGTTHMESHSGERSVSVAVEVGYDMGWKGSVTGTYGYTWSWSKQDSVENQRSLSLMRSHSQNTELREEGGQVKVGLAISNAGHIPFTIQNISLTVFRLEGDRLWPVAQLEADTERLWFEIGTWVPGERVEFPFVARELTLSEVEQILTSNLLVQANKYELKDENGQSFGHRTGAIEAACAQIVIDYGGKAPAESYMVSDRTASDERGVPLNMILDTLGIPYKTGMVAWTYRKRNQEGQLATDADAIETGMTQNGLLRLRNVSVDPNQGGYWLITHESPTISPLSEPNHYDLHDSGYRLEDIRVKSRQTVRFAYILDPDHDDLETRVENIYGTNPDKADTDSDGMADGDEIKAGTDPLWDKAICLPRIESVKYEKAGQQVNLTIEVPVQKDTPVQRLRIQWGDGSLAEQVQKPRGTVKCSHHYTSFGKYRIVVTPYAGPRSPGEPYEVDVSTVPTLLPSLVRQFGTRGRDQLNEITVDSEGNVYLAGLEPPGEDLSLRAGSGVFLVKYDHDGNRQWIVQTAPQFTTTGGLATDSDDNVHLVTYDRLGDYKGRKSPVQGTLLSKYNGQMGEILRTIRVEPTRPVRGFAPDESGNIYTYAQVDLGDHKQATSTYMYLRKVKALWGRGDANASINSGAEYGWSADLRSISPGVDVVTNKEINFWLSVRAIAVGASGGVYVCGFRRQPGYPYDNFKGSCFVARYDLDGELSWMQRHGDHRADQSVAVAVDGAGNAYVVDAAAGRTPDKPNRGLFDVRLVKYDRTGTLLWMRQFGTELHDIPFSVAVSPPVRPGSDSSSLAEVIYVTGVTQGALNEEAAYLDPNSMFNAFLVAFDKDGTRKFLQQFPTDGWIPEELKPTNLEPGGIMREWFTVSTSVATDERGNVYIAGSSETSLEPDYTNKGDADIFLMRFTPNPEDRE